MSTEEYEDYQAYTAWQSNYANTWSLFSGFTFTAITILLTQLPDLSQISAQVTLFVLAVMLDQFLFQLYTRDLTLKNCVRVAPQRPKDPLTTTSKPLNFLFAGFSWILLGGSVVLMFFVWNLIYLALASAIVGVLYIIVAHYLYKPWKQFLAGKVEHWVRV